MLQRVGAEETCELRSVRYDPSHHRGKIVRFPIAIYLLIAMHGTLTAQVQDVLEGPDFGLTAEEYARMAQVLSTSVELKELATAVSLKDALGRLINRLDARGAELVILVDTSAFEREASRMDVYSVPVKMQGLPDAVTADAFLHHVIEQIPGEQARLVVHRNHVEVTTRRAVDLDGVPNLLEWRIANMLGRPIQSGIVLDGSEIRLLGFVFGAIFLGGCLAMGLLWMLHTRRTNPPGRVTR